MENHLNHIYLEKTMNKLMSTQNQLITSRVVNEDRIMQSIKDAANKEVKANRPLQGQSPYLINAGIQFTSSDVNVSLLYNRIGERLALVGNEEFPSVFERPRNQLDFQISKKLFASKGEIKLNVADILNNAFYFYENLNEKTAYNADTDRMFNSYKPGSTITLGFTYDFNLISKSKN